MNYDEARNYWLVATPEQIQAINAALPPCTRVEPRILVGGERVLGADLLTDSAPGGTYGAAAAILESLPIVPVEPDLLPPSSDDA